MMNRCILHVEDEENDVVLQQYAFLEAGIVNPVQVVADGQQAIDYLAGAAPFEDREVYPLPCLVLLDLKLPRKPGLDVLRWIRAQPALKELIVIVLTSSQEPQDIERAYQLGANSYITKTLDLKSRLEVAQAFKTWWLQFNQFPEISAKAEPLVPQRALDYSGRE